MMDDIAELEITEFPARHANQFRRESREVALPIDGCDREGRNLLIHRSVAFSRKQDSEGGIDLAYPVQHFCTKS